MSTTLTADELAILRLLAEGPLSDGQIEGRLNDHRPSAARRLRNAQIWAAQDWLNKRGLITGPGHAIQITQAGREALARHQAADGGR